MSQFAARKRALLSSTGIKPLLQYNFTTSSVLPPWLAFSRAGNAMVYDSTGKLTYAPNNLQTYSNTFTNAQWIKTSVSLTAGVPDPFSGTNATTVTATAGGASAELNGATAGGPYTGAFLIAIWVRARAVTGNVWIYYNGVLNAIAPTGTWQQFYAVSSFSAGYPRPDIILQNNGDQIDVYSATLSAVTYETAPRSGDQVITTSAAYYGPRFDYPGGSADGLLVEGARTNLYLNSAVPALQTITVANSSTYTISFYGTGSIVVSGAYSGTITGSGVNVLTQKTFVAGSTSLSMAAPTGTVINVQVELGSYATYRIITAGSTITRAADVPTSAVPLTAYLAANPSIWELQDEATGTISRAVYTAGTFTFPTGKWYRSMAAYPIGTPTGYLNTKLTVGGPY